MASTALTPKARLLTIVDQSLPALKELVPKGMSAERILRTIRISINQNPKLAVCYPPTVIVSILRAAEMGLEVQNGFGHAYLVPFKNTKNNRQECQLIVGYQGWVELALRTGKVDDVNSICVFKEDDFEYQEGTDPKIVHRPNLDAERKKGSLTRVYSRLHTVSGFFRTHLMTATEIEAIRQRSKAKDAGPWQTDYLQMARKTPVRADAKYWPKTRELAMAIETEEVGEGIYEDETLGIVEELTGELNEKAKPAEATDEEIDQQLAAQDGSHADQ